MAESGHVWGLMVCEALGLDPMNVRRITVEGAANDVLRVTVEVLPPSSEALAAATAQLLAVGLSNMQVSVVAYGVEEGDGVTVEAQPGSGLVRFRVNPEERTEVLVQRRPRAGWEFYGRYEDEDAARRAVLRLARGERDGEEDGNGQ